MLILLNIYRPNIGQYETISALISQVWKLHFIMLRASDITTGCIAFSSRSFSINRNMVQCQLLLYLVKYIYYTWGQRYWFSGSNVHLRFFTSGTSTKIILIANKWPCLYYESILQTDKTYLLYNLLVKNGSCNYTKIDF